jgi:hypothetical protein
LPRAQASTRLKKDVYNNYQLFIDTSKEISNLENDMLDVRALLTDSSALLRNITELSAISFGTGEGVILNSRQYFTITHKLLKALGLLLLRERKAREKKYHYVFSSWKCVRAHAVFFMLAPLVRFCRSQLRFVSSTLRPPLN